MTREPAADLDTGEAEREAQVIEVAVVRRRRVGQHQRGAAPGGAAGSLAGRRGRGSSCALKPLSLASVSAKVARITFRKFQGAKELRWQCRDNDHFFKCLLLIKRIKASGIEKSTIAVQAHVFESPKVSAAGD